MKKNNAHYKLFGIVTNRFKMSGTELIHWHRERCGKSEEVHKIQKEDLIGGRLASKRFGANAAFWQVMILAFSIQALMQRCVLGKEWKCCHLKMMRDYFINKPAHVIFHGRSLRIRCATQEAYLVAWLVDRRTQILVLGRDPPHHPMD